MDEVAELKDESRVAERRRDKSFSQTRHGAWSDGTADTADFPFPAKPVCLKNGLNSSAQRTNSNPRGCSRLTQQEASPGLEKEIHMREQILQEKLRRLEEKILERILEEDRRMRLSEQAGGNEELGRRC